ncbi:hypothetical protein FA15DRAFT_704182 [Coprinopsis marcescibilis]|uniref:Fe2OG dioxygenase domain-containing protein n=1 Tax=Coprinopsis marcescibilis TaxID=230819 RepID=A0A5C3KWH3_COPMA|nr:hypothetical protein FA15DRAFT_704182 [Coprinopsis marcescibilis]
MENEASGHSTADVSEEQEETDLGEELSSALSADFDFLGKPYYSRTYTAVEGLCDNYKLKIDTVRVEDVKDVKDVKDDEDDEDDEAVKDVKLEFAFPLHETYVKKIIASASQAPFGKGEEKKVDKEVRDTWEIEGSRVSIEPNFSYRGTRSWSHQLEFYVLPDVCKGLGVPLTMASPQLELYKMLIYEPGGHFLPHQDTQKTDGMFATVVVVLPSQHSGGEVHVTHAGSTAVLDVSSDSKELGSVLAWYTDVVHEVKPVKSGYRVALSYNLIHATPNKPVPVFKTPNPLTDDEKTSRLRTVLEKWSKKEYEFRTVEIQRSGGEVKQPPYYAYTLGHDYSARDLSTGIQCLKGSDAHKISLILPIAKENGFRLGLANLKYKRSGCADDLYRHEEMIEELREEERQRRIAAGEAEESIGDDDFDADACGTYSGPISMINLDEEKYYISNVVDLDGKALGTVSSAQDEEADGRKKKKRKIEEVEIKHAHWTVLPPDPFRDAEPDEEDYHHEGYMGNDPGDLTYWYARAVLIIYHERDEKEIVPLLTGN